MPWSVRIEDERGKPLSDDDVVVEFRIMDDLPPGLIMLQGIDPYQNTTFNNAQLKFFLRVWETLAFRLTTAEDKLAWERVRSFAQRCLEEPHTYLKFIGD